MRLSGSAQRPHRFNQRPGRENARRVPEYAFVTATVAQATERALLLTNESLTAPVWVPRSLLEPSSKVRAHSAVRGQEVRVQVELSFALENGLV